MEVRTNGDDDTGPNRYARTVRSRRWEAPAAAFVHEYHWVHTGLGLVGNTAFLVGSVLFFWESTKVAGIWLFVVGATGMLIGSVGQAIVQGERRRFDGS